MLVEGTMMLTMLLGCGGEEPVMTAVKLPPGPNLKTPSPTTTEPYQVVFPKRVSWSPDGGVAQLDAFTLQTDGNTDAVSELTVALSPVNSSTVIGLLEVTDDAGGTVYGSVTDPATDSVVVTLAGLDANTTLTQYRIRITPKAHVDMPAPVGAAYGVQGIVAAFTPAGNGTGGSDIDSATVTVDNGSTGSGSLDTCTGVDEKYTRSGSCGSTRTCE